MAEPRGALGEKKEAAAAARIAMKIPWMKAVLGLLVVGCIVYIAIFYGQKVIQFALATTFNKVIVAAIVIGILYGLYNSVQKKLSWKRALFTALFWGVLFGALAWGVMLLFANFALVTEKLGVKGLGERIGGLAEKIGIKGLEKKEELFYSMWGGPKVEEPAAQSVDVRFINTVFPEGKPLDAIVELRVKNAVLPRLRLTPGCWFDDGAIETRLPAGSVGGAIEFTKAEQEQLTSFRCYATQAAEGKLKVITEWPVQTSTTLVVWLAQTTEPSKGVGQSTMKYAAPYSVEISILDDQPLIPGSHNLFLVVRKEEDVKLKAINSILLQAGVKDMELDCGEFGSGQSVQITNLDAEALRKYEQKEGEYVFTCLLDVIRAPEIPDKDFITAKTMYTIESEFSTNIKVV